MSVSAVPRGATALSKLNEGLPIEPNYLNMLLGEIGGSMGEVSAVALLVGGIYLVIRKVIQICVD